MIHDTDIAIIGGGFSGIMVAAHLVRSSTASLRIALFEKKHFLAKGLAYSTLEPTHLLNVPAGKMSAYPDDPAHFVEWLYSARTQWQSLHPIFAECDYDAQCFVPRMIYAAYLQDIWEDVQQQAHSKGHNLSWQDTHIASIDTQHHLKDTEGKEYKATNIILTTGHPALTQPHHSFTTPPTGYLPVLWGKDAEHYWQWVEKTSWHSGSHAVIFGTGLSAVDAFHSLIHHGFAGKITMISRSGVLPTAHATYAPHPAPELDALPHTAETLHDYLEQAMHEIEEEGRNWRAVIDSLRPITNILWQQLPLHEQQQFLRNYLSWWNVRRHRMPPDSYATLQYTCDEGQLVVHAGTIAELTHDGKDFTVHLKDTELHADCVMNAMGFNYRLLSTPHPLLQQLIKQHMLVPHPLGIGVQTDKEYRATSHLYVVGPLLFGERLESTAVPELRVQAKECAQQVLKTLPS